MENFKIAFIGSGNIAGSLIGGLIANGIDPRQLVAADPDGERRRQIKENYGIKIFDA